MTYTMFDLTTTFDLTGRDPAGSAGHEEAVIPSRGSTLPTTFEGDGSSPGGLSRPTSAQQVADYIRRMIFDNRLRAGERVPQDEIAAELRVSRVPVREAVIALDREGWVMIEPHRGAFVVGLDEQSTRDHYELLGRIYGLAAQRAAQRGSDEGLAALVTFSKLLLDATDPHEFSKLNLEFLRRMVALGGSRRLNTAMRQLAHSIVPGDFFAEVPGAMVVHKRGLRAVVKALKARDGEQADLELSAMLRREADKVVVMLEGTGAFGEREAD
jgi:DNA-binding GntR family transcriptional regulator